MKRALIIGFGSEIRGDDAFGPQIACLLEDIVHPAVMVDICQGLTPDIALTISEVDLVIFIDCAVGNEPGRIKHQCITPSDDKSLSMVHFLSPESLLTWCGSLYGKLPQAHVFTVTGQCYEISDNLTELVQQAMPKVIDQVLELLNQHDLPSPKVTSHA
ncbi:MAG: hydrogenase maturation protease [Phycisphaeraceae bacterium]|nr:hydrogenase maturation protease [Phycisphaeraceae bacterium]